jgi:pimeloyl-ACP methyl ester carboxylesterase
MTEFIYLHGFASGPGSNKAKAFKKRFDELGISIHVPDLQQGDFENLTLTGQIELVQGIIDKNKGQSFALIGSSMGGYLASLIAQTRESVQALFLMAPGFNFLNRWRKKLDISKTTDELIPVFHYRYNKEVRLNTYLFRDAETWESLPLDRKIPTFIVHGLHDETIDIEESRNFVRKKSFCSLKELDSDHGLLSCIDSIIEDSLGFFNQQKLL